MLLTQPKLDKVKPQNDSVPLFIQEPPRIDLSGAGIEDWIVPFLPVLERVNLERMRFENYQMAASPGLLISEAPIYESTTTLTDFEAHLTHEEETLIDEPLPRLPLQAQPIKVKLKIGGRGKPAFKLETEISL